MKSTGVQSSEPAKADEAAAAALREQRAVEKQLILRSQDGDVPAFEELVRMYERKFFWIAFNMVGHKEDAQDLAQEAFLRIYRSIKRFNVRYNFYTWAYRIVVNLCIDHLRKTRRNIPTRLDDTLEEPAAIGGPEPDANARELGEQVIETLRALPLKYKTVLVLRDIDELSCDEISKIIHCTPATTRWRLHRARELFSQAWDRQETAAT